MKLLNLIKLIKVTSGKRHGWYMTDKDFEVRKPLGMIYNQEIKEEIETNLERNYPVITLKLSWWRRLLNWLWK